MRTNKIIGALMLSVAAAIWGGMFVVVKDIVGLISPVTLVWLRYLVAAPVLLLFCWLRRVHWVWRRRDVWLMVAVGVIGNTVSIVTQETGTWWASAQLGAVITAATPAFMVLFAWGLLHQRPTRGDWLSLGCAGAGVLCIVGLTVSGQRVAAGAGMLFIAGVTWALMSTLLRLIEADVDALQVTLVATVVALICLTPWVLGHAAALATIDFAAPRVWLSLLYLGAVSTATAFVLWNAGLRRLNSNASGLFFLWQPVVGAVLGRLFLGEALGLGFVVGTALIALSIVVAMRVS